MDSDDKKITQLARVTSLSDSDLFAVVVNIGTAPVTKAIEKSNVLNYKIISFTRDGTAASGDVAYTGVGFKPKSLHALANVNGTTFASDGFSDSAKTCASKYFYGNNLTNAGLTLISYTNQTSWAQSAIVKTYDADGFTLTWTKVGSPTAGTINISVICFG